MMDLVDERKEFILTTTGKCLGFKDEEIQRHVHELMSEKSLDAFLDSITCFTLSIKQINKYKLHLNNEVTSGDGNKIMLVFFKVRPEVVTPNNLHDIVFFCSMIDSPLTAFYHAIQRIYAPALLKDDQISQNVQSLVTDLETNLKSAVLRSSNGISIDNNDLSAHFLAEVISIDDELHFWTNVINIGKHRSDKEKAKAFIEALEPLCAVMRDLELHQLSDLDEVIESAHNYIDDLWKIDEYRFPQTRMEHLMDVIGDTLISFILKKLKALDLWDGQFIDIQEALNQSVSACDKWCLMCERLTSLFWPHHSLHQWNGGPYSHEYLKKFSCRLKEILRVRTVCRQLTRLLTVSEQQELNSSDYFNSFKDVSPLLVNQYTEPFWQTAIKQFENNVHPAEERVAAKLKTQLRSLDTNTLQLVQELNRYQDLIERPVLRQYLVAEREMLLSLLQDYVSSITVDGGSIKLVDMPPVVCSLYWVHQQQSKLLEIEKTGKRLLGDLSGWKQLYQQIEGVRNELKQYHTDLFDTWTRQTGAAISERSLGLNTDEPVVSFEQGKLMRVNYDPRLVKLVREVRQLSVLGYVIPATIVDTAHLAKDFMKQARALQQVATFHNTIGDRMIISQRPMMLSAAVELARLVREQHSVTWSDTTAVDLYIGRLQAAVQRLYTENNKLAAFHDQILQQVSDLMETDLLRQQQKWKDGLRYIRDIISQVEEQFSNMKSWCVHWDHQLYKALEHRYQIGLEAINQHLPEIKIELVYRQQKLQFNPPMEEIRMKYYRQLKHFMSIPLNFRGVSDTHIFPSIIEHNAHRFRRVFERAEQLFKKLQLLSDEWIDRSALGNVDWDVLVEQHLIDAQDWDINFRASKSWGQQIAKLPTGDHKIGCFTVSVTPVRAEIEMHNRKYWDVLSSSLHSSVIRDVTMLEKFVSESRNSLEQAPQSLTEVGEANNRHQAIAKAADKMVDLIDSAVKKNRILASWTKERVEHVSHMTIMWDNLQSLLNNQQMLISKQVETMKSNLVSEAERIADDIERYALHWKQLRPKEDNLSAVTSNANGAQTIVQLLKEKRIQWDNLIESTIKIRDDFIQFGMEPPEFNKCDEVEEDLKHHENIWAVYEQFMTGLSELGDEEWIVLRSRCQSKFDSFLSDWTIKLTEEGKPVTTMSAYLLQEIQRYKDMLPVIKYVRGEMFSDKHWVELFGILNIPYKPIEQLLFSDLLPLRDIIVANCSALQDLNNRAAGEVVIRQALSDLDIWEVEAKFTLISHTDSRGNTVYLIKDFTDVMTKVGDNQCLLQSVKSSANYENFIDRTAIWETRLTDLDNYLRMLHQVQRKWVYLEPIFGASTLNVEKSRFDRVDRDVRFILNELSSGDQRVVGLCRIPNLNHILQSLCQHLSHCQKNLLDFLEDKRNKFPRFYFLGDEDLLEILGQSQKQEVILSHLKKLFTGIHSVEFKDGSIISMCSMHGEIVPLSKPVPVMQNVEEWLSLLAVEMKSTLQELVCKCLKAPSPDPLLYPLQVLCLAERVSFTKRCEEAISSGRLSQLLSSLHAQLEEYTQQQNEWKGGASDEQKVTSLDFSTNVLQLKLKSLLMDTIYHKNLVTELVRNNVTSLDDWDWQRRLRFYSGTSKSSGTTVSNKQTRLSSDTVIVKMVDVQFEYSYEYQGNADKLVHTPLTDKCYLTLTQAMNVGLGGNPYGPAGTGKTESVKALAALLGRQVLVFNCDEGIDVQSLTRILMGLVKCGAWGCFDEFNRLEEATLSAISMQIHRIQEALRTNSDVVELLGQQVPVDHKTGLFVTLNPAGRGYGGRQQLPDNLKQLFRPVAMSQPDERLIAEVILHCEGFLHADDIAHKLVTLFTLARKLLSQQQHYDWGLRALKTVIGGCGTAMRQTKLKGDKDSEMSLVVKIVRLNILSKLTFSDCYCFDELIKDTFCGIHFESSGRDQIVKAINEAYNDLGFIHSTRQERKCIELYEQLIQRMGVVLVGTAGSGKTTVINLLKLALSKLGSTVKQNIINPKAMSRTQLLGQTDPDTRQWSDGVLSSTAQSVYNQADDVQSWIVFDGDIDPEWVESLNSVLDDNRLLTLPSGWRIQFGPNVHFLFETNDLKHASPATISRMGVILISEEEFDSKHIIEAWLLKQPENEAEIISRFIDDYFHRGVSWVMERGEMVVPCSRVGIINNGLSLLSGATTIASFSFNFAAGLGSLLTSNSRESFYKQLFEWTGELLPDGIGQQLQWSQYDDRRDRIEDFIFDKDYNTCNKDNFNSYTLVVTGRIKAASTTLISWLTSHQPFVLIGPSGSGKSILLEHCLKLLQSQSHAHLHLQVATIYCSAHVTPQHVLQKLSQLCMVVSSSTGRVYKPKNGQRLILHLKDINLIRPDKWGTSMLVTFIQQLLMYGAFYDTNLEWVALENVQIITSVSSADSISSRFLSLNRIYYLSSPENNELRTIFGAYSNTLLNNKKSSISLASTMVNIYQEVKNNIQNGLHAHYMFTPRDLTRWCIGLMRYPLHDSQCTVEALLYEALRLFKDRLVCDIDKIKLNNILTSILDSDSQWMMSTHNQITDSATPLLTDVFFVTDPSSNKSNKNAFNMSCGPNLMRLNDTEWSALVQKEIVRLGIDDTIVLIPELYSLVAINERVLSCPGQSLVLAGRPGSGRKTSIRIVASRLSANVFTLKIGPAYSVNHFKNDLKKVMQLAGLEGEEVYFILEDYQLISTEFLDMVNSLLSSGEVPGLYQVEELENLTASIKDLAEQCNFYGSSSQFFTKRVQDHLHIILCFDYNNDDFKQHLTSNPAILKHCCLIWLNNWRKQSMKMIPKILINRETDKEVPDGLLEMFLTIYDNQFINKDDSNNSNNTNTVIANRSSSTRQYFAMITTYLRIILNYENGIKERQLSLQAGVSKLNEARNVVSTLKLEAAEQERLLAEKQEKATSALEMITETMSNANVHRGQMEELKKKTEHENEMLMIRKEEIDTELAEIEPLIQEACSAVGNIKSESLSEIRSLRAPPDVIRDILEGVLRLMGIQDTSWNSMKTFLAKRGVKEDIRCFDAHKISRESRESVEQLLLERKESFEAKTAKRASVAAAPLAAWVTANVKYSKVLEKIRPLEKEQAKLQRNLKLAEERINQLSTGLDDVDQTVAELKTRLNTFTREAAEIEIHLNSAQDTITAAEGLVSKLDDEFNRWQDQLQELSDDLTKLPVNSLVAAAFLIYLASLPQDSRSLMIEKWCEIIELEKFNLFKFLSTEQELMKWQSEGLPSDIHSIENAIVISMTELCPLLIDPSSQATEWLIKHYQQEQQKNNDSSNGRMVEITMQANSRFYTTLELAVRFGKVLIVCEVTHIDPVLYPILRRDFTYQGPRKMIQVGEKLVDYNSDFKMYLISRSDDIKISPNALALMCKVNFTTSPAGLTQQLLSCALKEERPELENRRTEFLQQEERLRLELHSLQEAVLRQLASADGNILQNKELLASLNETKRSSAQISKSLKESEQLQSELNVECNVYRPLAEYASRLYFAVISLRHVNNLYCLSTSAFTRLYVKSLKSTSIQDSDNNTRCRCLLHLVYFHICRSVFRSDRLTFALYLVHEMCPHLFQIDEWKLFMGEAIVEGFDPSANRAEMARLSESVPAWLEQDRVYDVFQLKTILPDLYSKLDLDNLKKWKGFPRSNSVAPITLSLFQHVLLVKVLAPDCLHSAISTFALRALGLETLSAPALSLAQLVDETIANEPILLISAQGTDPSIELRSVATTKLTDEEICKEVSLGQGQEKSALDIVISAASVGSWVILKNLHLMIKWLPSLESELCRLSPHPKFRLWMTTQQHPDFPSTLASTCLKLTYESPQGVKRNMQRTYSSWERSDKVHRPFFNLAWFHALVSERRMFIPQGWTKYYEFNETDITAATLTLNNIINKAGGKEDDIRWEYLRGLCENAIYGGRIDNPYDLRVLTTYLQLMFTSNIFKNNNKIASGINIPNSDKISEHLKIVYKLPDADDPVWFGLPENVDRSWQRNTSAFIINQIKVISVQNSSSSYQDKSGLNNQQDLYSYLQLQIGPLLNLWKKLNQGVPLIKSKASNINCNNVNPIDGFILREYQFAVKLIQYIHSGLASITKLMRASTNSTSVSVISDFTSLMTLLIQPIIRHQTPEDWLKVWEGPCDPTSYLRSVMSRAVAVNTLYSQQQQKLSLTLIDLADVFHPDTLLNALCQQTAREKGISVGDLTLKCSWDAPNAQQKQSNTTSEAQLTVVGLQLEGATFSTHAKSLSANTVDSPDVSVVPPLTLTWTNKIFNENHSKNVSPASVLVPLYSSSDRKNVIAELTVPCQNNEQHVWMLSGTAFYIHS